MQSQRFLAPDYQFAGASGGQAEGEIPRAGLSARLENQRSERRVGGHLQQLQIGRLRADLAAPEAGLERADAGQAHVRHVQRRDRTMAPLGTGVRVGHPILLQRVIHAHRFESRPTLAEILHHHVGAAALGQRP